jgi:hypothetical protein
MGAADGIDLNRQWRTFERGDTLRTTTGFAETPQVRLHRFLFLIIDFL